MSWISKIFNYVPAKGREGISLEHCACWEISSAKDMPAFLRALFDLVPPQSVLYLEGGSPTKDIQLFLDTYKASEITKVAMGTIWPRPKCFHMIVTLDNLEGLAHLMEKHATAEASIHLHVYKYKKVILQWYDAFFDPFFISKEIPEDKVRAFCERLGVSYK